MAMSLHDRQPSSVRGKNPAFRRPVSRVGKERLLRWETLRCIGEIMNRPVLLKKPGQDIMMFLWGTRKVEYLIN